jgi:hypothetical protein
MPRIRHRMGRFDKARIWVRAREQPRSNQVDKTDTKK